MRTLSLHIPPSCQGIPGVERVIDVECFHAGGYIPISLQQPPPLALPHFFYHEAGLAKALSPMDSSVVQDSHRHF